LSARSGYASACQHGASRLVSTPPGFARRLVSLSAQRKAELLKAEAEGWSVLKAKPEGRSVLKACEAGVLKC
jgi:hypothetical protein